MKALDPDRILSIRENFDFFDEDHNGHIDLDEFTKLLKVIAPRSTDQEAQVGFELIDADSNGYIDFNEFITWWESCWWEFVADDTD